MTAEKITYGDYTISAELSPVEETGKWAAVLTISRGAGEGQESWLISAGDDYPGKEEARDRCFDFARELVDREMKGCGLD